METVHDMCLSLVPHSGLAGVGLLVHADYDAFSAVSKIPRRRHARGHSLFLYSVSEAALGITTWHVT